MFVYHRIISRHLQAKPIPIPKHELRDLTRQIVERWLAVLNKTRRPRYDEDETTSPLLWGNGHKLYDPTILTGVQVQPFGYKWPVSLSITAKIDRKARPGRVYVLGGELVHRKRSDGKFLPFELGIKFSPFISPAEYKTHRTAVERELFSILIHEFTHAKDFVSEKYQGTEELTEPIQYHNSPVEVRAFLQQIVDEVEQYIRQQVEPDGDTWGLKDNPTELVQRALDQSFTWQRIYRDLNPENRRYILRSVGSRAISQFEELEAEFGKPKAWL